MQKKILVVDDDVNSLKEAEAILKEAGYLVLTFEHPKFILKVIKQEKPDAIISDIIMPHYDGYALCQEIRKLFGDKVPIILCTAKPYEQELIDKAYKDFGANNYIIKPFKKEELLGKIKTALGE